MYFCICNAVTNKQVRDLLESGKTVKEVQVETKCGTSCGICLTKLWEIASDIKNDKKRVK